MFNYKVKVSVDTKEPASEEYNMTNNSVWRAIYNSLYDFKGNLKAHFKTLTIEVEKGAEVVKAKKEKVAEVKPVVAEQPVATAN